VKNHTNYYAEINLVHYSEKRVIYKFL